nr:MAG TPA: nucelotide kinase [Caudoviricetes sp.]
MDVVFLRPVWLYLPDGSKERIIAQTGDNTGISFDSVHASVERRHYFRYNDYSITQTERGDYVVSPVDDECEKIYYPNGTYEHVSKVVPHEGFWEAHVRHTSDNEWRVKCWSRSRAALEQKCDGWHWRRIGKYQWTNPGYELKFANEPIRFHVSNDYDAPVRRTCRYFTGEWCIWYENEKGGEAFLTFNEQRYELTLCDDTLYVTEKCDDIFDIAEKNGGGVAGNVHENVVSHPSHYAFLDPEPITFIRDRDYLTGSALKYIFRAGHKNGADENVDMGKAAWYLRELVNKRGGQTVIAILRNVYWDTIDRQLAPEDRAREVRDRLTEFMSAISHDHLSDYIPEEK